MAKIEKFEDILAWQKSRELGSISEMQSQLYVGLDLGYIKIEEFNEVYELASETARLTTGFIRYLKEN